MRSIEATPTRMLSSDWEFSESGGEIGRLHIGRWGRPTTWESPGGTATFERRSMGSWLVDGDLTGPVEVDGRFFSSKSTLRWAGREAIARGRSFRSGMVLEDGDELIAQVRSRGFRRYVIELAVDVPVLIGAVLVFLADRRQQAAAAAGAGG